MIRSWADLEDFLASGGRMRFAPGVDPGGPTSWRTDDARSEEIAASLATRAVAEQKAVPLGEVEGEQLYGRAA